MFLVERVARCGGTTKAEGTHNGEDMRVGGSFGMIRGQDSHLIDDSILLNEEGHAIVRQRIPNLKGAAERGIRYMQHKP